LDELVFEVESRRRIYEAVCKFPGIHLRELSRTVDLKLNLVDYHLLYLEKREIIYSLLDGQFKRYYPKDMLDADHKKDIYGAPDKQLVGLLRQPIPFRIIVLLARSGVMSHKDLTEALHKSPSTVSHHLDKLHRAGAVTKSPEGRGYALSDPARIERILVSFTPHPETLADGFLEIWENLYI
jgi:predicted transcriptional regulator